MCLKFIGLIKGYMLKVETPIIIFTRLYSHVSEVVLLSRILESLIKVGYPSRFKSFYPIFSSNILSDAGPH